METTIGGDRLGSGNKQQLSYRNYERSTHDLSELWRSTMSAGTLVPFLKKLALPGDTWDIELNCEVLTLPTVGPLFGSYKVQLDVFEVPIRLYNAKLHMNKLGVGMDMSKIFLPQLEVWANNDPARVKEYKDNEQVNPSSLLKYLGISGIGHLNGAVDPAVRKFNAVPFLAYWDIYKNYYSNKQEEIGMYIHTAGTQSASTLTPGIAFAYPGGITTDILAPAGPAVLLAGTRIKIMFGPETLEIDPATPYTMRVDDTTNMAFTDICDDVEWDDISKTLWGTVNNEQGGESIQALYTPWQNLITGDYGIFSFPLSNIDEMREKILQYSGQGAFVIDETAKAPYSSHLIPVEGDIVQYAVELTQEQLAIKTYQSDLFNNWINTEWIEGDQGVNELTKVLITDDSFTIDALNIAQKVYTMLNRIAVSGGTYDDWLEAVYTHERVKAVENPVYMGSLIKELAFQEVISNAATENNPLGTLAGRGVLTNKHKGGKIIIKTNEPSIILGIVSLTPRVEYSQGNDWDVNLKTFDDFHKPALDAIGFQDLISEQMVWSDSELDSATGEVTYRSVGKQPAWINYMTSVNKTFGNFAIDTDSMFMTLNRRYSKNAVGRLIDPTTYIDPTKFNNIFAETSLDSQNFWVQISSNITARRKMSAKVIPNL